MRFTYWQIHVNEGSDQGRIDWHMHTKPHLIINMLEYALLNPFSDTNTTFLF